MSLEVRWIFQGFLNADKIYRTFLFLKDCLLYSLKQACNPFIKITALLSLSSSQNIFDSRHNFVKKMFLVY